MGKSARVCPPSVLPEGNSGGPVFDTRGSLVGIVRGRDAARPELGIATPMSQVDRFLSRHGIAPLSNLPEEDAPVDRVRLLRVRQEINAQLGG